jgi:RNA 2',3'-cyclic 3'-phosphodiesterase
MRLFLAIHPQRLCAEALLGLIRSDGPTRLPLNLPQHRLVGLDQVHSTIMFIGDRDRRELDDCLESARACCAGVSAFDLQAITLTALPERGPKRTLVVDCDRPAELGEIHDRAVHRFACDPKPNARDRFLPHLTIARFPGAGATLGADSGLPHVLFGHEAAQPFRVEHVSLMSSVLRPDGAQHKVVATFPLR